MPPKGPRLSSRFQGSLITVGERVYVHKKYRSMQNRAIHNGNRVRAIDVQRQEESKRTHEDMEGS